MKSSWWALVTVLLWSSEAAASRVRVALDETLAEPILLRVLAGKPKDERLGVRIHLRWDPAGEMDSLQTVLEERIAAYRAAGVDVWVAIEVGKLGGEVIEPWKRFVRTVAERSRGRVAGYQFDCPTLNSDVDVPVLGFFLKTASIEVKTVDARESVGVTLESVGELTRLEKLFEQDIAPYVDAITVDVGARRSRNLTGRTQASTLTLDDVNRVLGARDPSAAVWLQNVELGPDVAAGVADFVLRHAGTRVELTSFRAPTDPTSVSVLLQTTSHLRDVLSGDIVYLDERESGLVIRAGDRDVTEVVRHRLLFNASTFATYLVAWLADGVDGRVAAELRLTGDVSVMVKEPTTGRQTAPEHAAKDGSGRVRVEWTQRAPLVVIDFNAGATDTFALRSDVEGAAVLSVAEIVARHQQALARQDRALDHYVASARMEQHFRPTMADPGYDVVSDNRFFYDREGTEWEELSFSVNGTRWGADRPAFPLLQAERVLSLPLDLRLTADYRYTLEGSERLGDRQCYVVRFEPIAEGRSLYRGRMWIDGTTFDRLKTQAVQTNLKPPVVSNEEIQRFEPESDAAGRVFHLFTRLTSRQIVLVAGRNLLVEKVVTFSDFKVNDDGFSDLREAAHQSDRIMYRETDEGLRYFAKEQGRRVVSTRPTTSAKALAMGTVLDPSFDFPLPIFGINYLDFEFGSPNRQLALLFGGVLAFGNIQAPKLFGARTDGSIDFSAIAVPSSDHVFAEAQELEQEALLTWPSSVGANLGYQVTDFQKVGIGYQVRFDAFVRDSTTSEAYEPPASTVTQGVGGTYEYRRGGYSLNGGATWFGRATWRPWGFAASPESSSRTYSKYQLSLSKDFYFGPFQKIHLNAAYFGGRRLDRFSRYQFGLFEDTRIHGVPASGLRFDELGVARFAYSFNIFEEYRLDLFLDQAYGRSPSVAPAWKGLTGLGAAVSLRAPFHTLLRVDAGKSVLPSVYKTTGSFTVQILVLKPM